MPLFPQRQDHGARGSYFVGRELGQVGVLDLMHAIHREVGVMNDEG